MRKGRSSRSLKTVTESDEVQPAWDKDHVSSGDDTEQGIKVSCIMALASLSLKNRACRIMYLEIQCKKVNPSEAWCST